MKQAQQLKIAEAAQQQQAMLEERVVQKTAVRKQSPRRDVKPQTVPRVSGSTKNLSIVKAPQSAQQSSEKKPVAPQIKVSRPTVARRPPEVSSDPPKPAKKVAAKQSLKLAAKPPKPASKPQQKPPALAKHSTAGSQEPKKRVQPHRSVAVLRSQPTTESQYPREPGLQTDITPDPYMHVPESENTSEWYTEPALYVLRDQAIPDLHDEGMSMQSLYAEVLPDESYIAELSNNVRVTYQDREGYSQAQEVERNEGVVSNSPEEFHQLLTEASIHYPERVPDIEAKMIAIERVVDRLNELQSPEQVEGPEAIAITAWLHEACAELGRMVGDGDTSAFRAAVGIQKLLVKVPRRHETIVPADDMFRERVSLLEPRQVSDDMSADASYFQPAVTRGTQVAVFAIRHAMHLAA